LTEGVFVSQLSSNVNLYLTKCVGYNNLLFHEQYVRNISPHHTGTTYV